MNDVLLDLFNKQVNREFYTSYLYYAMSSYFDEIMMKGFCLFMRHKASIELALAQKMHEYLILRDEKLSFLKIDEITPDWVDVSDIFLHILNHEEILYNETQKLYLNARQQEDIGVMEFLKEIIFSKTKSLSMARKIVFRIKNSSVTSSGIDFLDKHINKI